MSDRPQKDNKYPKANLFEIVEYIRENDYNWKNEDAECFVISSDKKRGSGKTFKSVKKSQGKDLDKLLLNSSDRSRIMELWEKLNFPIVSRGGGGGKIAKTREEYIAEISTMGVSSNKSGVLQLNIAKIFDLSPDRQIDGTRGNNTVKVDQFPKKDFKFSFDEANNTISVKLTN